MRHNNIDNESIKEPKTDNRPLTIMDSAITITFWIIAGITLVYMSFTASKYYDNMPDYDAKTQDNKKIKTLVANIFLPIQFFFVLLHF